MKVKEALTLLNDLPLEAEICIEWYEKEHLEYEGKTISNEVWSKALNYMDKWSEMSDLHDSLQYAISEIEGNDK
jgi:hypothetical protein